MDNRNELIVAAGRAGWQVGPGGYPSDDRFTNAGTTVVVRWDSPVSGVGNAVETAWRTTDGLFGSQIVKSANEVRGWLDAGPVDPA